MTTKRSRFEKSLEKTDRKDPELEEFNAEQFIRECYDNFPEASVCLKCTLWDYKKFVFKFLDDEGKEHEVTLLKALVGLEKFKQAVARGELKGLGLPAHYLTDTGAWDAFAFDALNQMAIYGEVIYG